MIVYCSATANRLKIIEPIRNQGLRLMTGAFRSSPIECLHAECNILPLRYLFDLQCATYEKSKQSNSCVSDLLRSSYLQAELWNFISRAERLLDLLPDKDNIQVMESKWLECPPWRISDDCICFLSLNASKLDYSREFINAQFLAHLDSHRGHIGVFTDRSKRDAGVGSAMTIPDLSISDQRSLNAMASIFTAELYAILMALKIIRMLPHINFVIFSDLRSAILATRKIGSSHPLVQEIQMWLYKISSIYKKSIILCWVPAHVGIKGNELVDKLAKNAVLQHNIFNQVASWQLAN
jgi:ribonuclease HI